MPEQASGTSYPSNRITIHRTTVGSLAIAPGLARPPRSREKLKPVLPPGSAMSCRPETSALGAATRGAKGLVVFNQRIPISQVMRHCTGVARLGYPIDHVLRQSLIERSFGDDRDQVSFDQFGLLILNAARWVEDETSGLSKRRIASGIATLAAHVVMGCSTLEYAWAALSRVYQWRAVHFGVVVDGREDALLAVQSEATRASAVQLAPILEELYTVLLFGIVCYLLGRPIPVRAHHKSTRSAACQPAGAALGNISAPVCLANVLVCVFRARSSLRIVSVRPPTGHSYWDILRPWLALADGHAALADARCVRLEDLRIEVLAAGSLRQSFDICGEDDANLGWFSACPTTARGRCQRATAARSSRSVEAIGPSSGTPMRAVFTASSRQPQA